MAESDEITPPPLKRMRCMGCDNEEPNQDAHSCLAPTYAKVGMVSIDEFKDKDEMFLCLATVFTNDFNASIDARAKGLRVVFQDKETRMRIDKHLGVFVDGTLVYDCDDYYAHEYVRSRCAKKHRSLLKDECVMHFHALNSRMLFRIFDNHIMLKEALEELTPLLKAYLQK